MEDSGYNGWANYPTWVVNLWLGNDEGTYNECCFMAREALRAAPHDENSREYVAGGLDGAVLKPIWTVEETARYRLADTLSSFVAELQAFPTEAGLAADLLRYVLGEVDWNEIATSWLEVAKEEESYA
jgi:hypothetical protein